MSSNGYYELILQENGNLEITCATEIKIWESNTKGKNIDGLYFAKGGVALYQNEDTKGSAWSAGPWRRNTGPEKLIMQDDGNLVMLDKDGNILWESGSTGKCPIGMKMSENTLQLKYSLNWTDMTFST